MTTTRALRAGAGIIAATLLSGPLAGTASADPPQRERTASERPLHDEGQRLTERERIAVELEQGVFERGDTSLVDRYVLPTYIQHNPFAGDGPEPLKQIATALHEQFPLETFRVERVFSEGDLVVLHANYVLVPGTPGNAVIDILRFEGDKVAEHWDVVQPAVFTTPSGHDMFAQLSGPLRPARDDQARATTRNRATVLAYVDALQRGDTGSLDRYLARDVIQHDPNVADGIEATAAAQAELLQSFPAATFSVKRVVADGELVAVHGHLVRFPGDRGQAVLDIYRLRGGRIVEHWGTVQDVPETAPNDNTMF